MKLPPVESLLALMLVIAACAAPAGKEPKSVASARSGDDAAVVAKFLKDNQLLGQVVLVQFGTVSCSLSNEGLEKMIDLRRRQAIDGLLFARLETVTDTPVFQSYYAEKAPPFPVLRDPEMVVARALGTTVYPRYALLDKFGHVRYRGGMPRENELRDWTRQLLAENRDPGPAVAQFGTMEPDMPRLLGATVLPDLAGTSRSLAEYRGRLGMLVTFVDTRCPFSGIINKQVPGVASVLDKHGVSTVLVNITDPEAAVRKLYGSGVAGATVLYDTGKMTQKQWAVQFVPLAVLVDFSGRQAYRGSPVWPDVAAAVAKMAGLPADAVQFNEQGTRGG